MKKLYYFLGFILAMMLSPQRVLAGDFVPEEGETYYILAKGQQLYLGADDKGGAVLQTPLKATQPYYTLTFEAVDGGGYHIINGDGMYLCYESWSMFFQEYDEENSGAYLYDFILDEANGGYRISVMTKGSYMAPDNVGDGSAVYSDKPATHANGVFEIVKSGSLSFAPAIKFDAESLSIEYDNEGAENRANLMFTPTNFEGTLSISTSSDDFQVSDTELEVTDGEMATIEVTSEAGIGTKGSVIFTYEGTQLATLPVEVVTPSPSYYIINVESGLVIGGETDAVLVERADDPSQFFKKVLVPGTTDEYYFIQKSSGLYLKRVEEGAGVMAWYVEIGANSRSKWKLTQNGSFYGLKNTEADRILMADKLEVGAGLLCYGLSSDPGTQWELIDAAEIAKGEPYVEVKDKNVVVEKNGLTFTTDVRAFNLNGKSVKVETSDKVSVSLTSISEGFAFQQLTISTSAEPGTECEVRFMLDDQVAQTLKFTVQPNFERYLIRALQPIEVDEESGDTIPQETIFAIGSEEESTQPILKELDPKDVSQWFLLVPAAGDAYYIVQDGTFNYLAKSDRDSYNTTLDVSNDREWTVETRNDTTVIRNVAGGGCLGPDKYEVGTNLFANRGSMNWNLVPLGRMELDTDEVVLETKETTAEVTVTAANLENDITVTVSDGFTVDKTLLAREGGKVVVGYAKDSTQLEGTVTFTSGIYTESLKVRLKNTTLGVDKESLTLTGKNASAQFIVNGTDWEQEIMVAAEGEGFAVDVTRIEPAAVIATMVTVSYSGTKSTSGKVIVTSGDFRQEIPVEAVIDSKITVNEPAELLVFDETGSAYFTVTATDLFEDITVAASSDKVQVEPVTLPMDAEDEYVFLTYEEGAKQYDVTITLTSGDVKTEIVVKGADGEDTGVGSVKDGGMKAGVVDGVLTVTGAPAGAVVCVTDLAGRTVTVAGNTCTLEAKGLYVVSVKDGGKTLGTFKVLND